MISTVLSLSVGNTMMSVSLFRSWRANRSCLVMFDGGDLALERILITSGLIMSVYSDESRIDSI